LDLLQEYRLMRVFYAIPLLAAVGLALAGCDAGRQVVKRPPKPVEATAVLSVPGMT
jgi:hypothetical protein